MRKVILLLFLCHTVSAVTHSLKYFYTASSGLPNFPEFVAVGLVDEVQMFHYDSNSRRAEPKQDWMSRFTADKTDYWEQQTEVCVGHQRDHKASIEVVKQRFSQTGGVHIVQWMYGCEWDDETDKVNGYDQYGYDGEDFIVLDMQTLAWIAPKPQAFITKYKWDRDDAWIAHTKHYLTQECIDWLKKYVEYGKSSLQRTDLPSVSLLQKSPSSPVSCHATGFYPDRAVMFWRKDGEELHADHPVKVLPNHDGTFQMSVDLNLSSVTPEDWRRYDCVFHLSGVEDDIVTKLDKAVIRTNEEKPSDMTVIIIAVVVVLALVLIAAIGFMVYKKEKAKSPLCDMKKTSPDTYSTGTLTSRSESETSSSSSDNPSTESVHSNTPLMKAKSPQQKSETSSSSSSTGGPDSNITLIRVTNRGRPTVVFII